MQRVLAVATLSLLTASRVSAQTAGLAEKSLKVDSIMSTLVRAGSPGAAVMVIDDGKVVHKKGYGLANVDANEPIDASTIFDLASFSKQFTAMGIMILAESGKLGYDDPLTKFFPEFPAYASKITVRHLLNHTSGLPDYMGVFSRLGKRDFEPTGREALGMLAEIPTPLFAPGEKWEYSNSGYVVLAQIVEKASGMSFPAFMKKNVFDPLGMSHTLVADEVRPKIANRAISYRPVSDHFENVDYTPLNRIYGDGNVNTSLDDLFKWDQALYTGKLISQATLEKAFTPGKLNDGSNTNYGFGWAIGDLYGRRVVQHGGAWVGFRTYIERIPSERFTVILLSNLASFRPQVVGEQIAHVYLDQRLAPAK